MKRLFIVIVILIMIFMFSSSVFAFEEYLVPISYVENFDSSNLELMISKSNSYFSTATQTFYLLTDSLSPIYAAAVYDGENLVVRAYGGYSSSRYYLITVSNSTGSVISSVSRYLQYNGSYDIYVRNNSGSEISSGSIGLYYSLEDFYSAIRNNVNYELNGIGKIFSFGLDSASSTLSTIYSSPFLLIIFLTYLIFICFCVLIIIKRRM